MPLTRWLRHAQENRGLTGSQAQVQWDEKEAAYGRGMLSQKYWKKENDQLWLAMPYEDYVDEGRAERHLGELACLHQRKRKPEDEDLRAAGERLSLAENPLQVKFRGDAGPGPGPAPKTPPSKQSRRQAAPEDLPSTEKLQQKPEDGQTTEEAPAKKHLA